MSNQTGHDWDEAVQHLNEIIKSTVEFLGGSSDVRELPLTIQDLDEAIQDLNKLIRTNPDDPILYINRGNAYFYIRDYERAISDYSKIIHIYPDSAKAYLSRGDAHFCKGEYDKAITDYCKAIQINSEYAEAYYARSEAYDCKGDSDKAGVDSYEALKLGFDLQSYAEDSNLELIEDLVQSCPKNAKVYYYRGLVRACSGDYNLAIADYSKAIQLNPRLAHAYHKRAEIYNYYVITRDPECPNYDKVILDYDKTISDYDKAQELGYGYRGTPGLGLIGITNPTIELFFQRGEIYAQKEDYDSAIADMSEVINREDSFNADYDKFVLRIDEDIQLSEDFWSSDHTSSHVGSDPSARAYNNRGFYHHKKGEYELAIADLKEALRLYNEQDELIPDSNPDFATVYLNLGSVYYADQDYDTAIENYDNVVRLCPNYETDFIESKFVHGGQDAVEVAIKLLRNKVNNPPQNAGDFYYTGLQGLFSNDLYSAELAFQIALLLDYDDKEKIQQHLTNLKNQN